MRRGMVRMRKGKPACEAGFFVVADRVRWRRREEFASGWGKKEEDDRRRGSFMERALWERAGPAA